MANVTDTFITTVLAALDKPNIELPIRFHFEPTNNGTSRCVMDSAGAPTLNLELAQVKTLVDHGFIRRAGGLYFTVDHDAVRRWIHP